MTHTLRAAIDRVARLLASRTLSFWLMGAWLALALVWVVPFQLTEQPETTVATIAQEWLPFRLLYGALGITTLVCAWRRLQLDTHRFRSAFSLPTSGDEASGYMRLPHSDSVVARKLKDSRFRLLRSAEGDAFTAVRYPVSLFGGSVFHLALIGFAAAVVFGSSAVQAATVEIIEGQSFDEARGGDSSVNPALRSATTGLTLEQISPVFFEDVLLFERLDATVLRGVGKRHTLSLARPLWLDSFTYLSIQDVDIAPRLVLADSSGMVLEDRFVSADLFPPGEEASLQMESVPHQVTAIAFFDHAVRDGRDISSSYNFRDIRLLVTVIQSVSDGRIAARGLLAPGDSLEFDGFVLSMPEIARIGTFRVTRSLAWPWMTLFGALAVAGLGARVFFPCHQVRVRSDGNGVSVAVRLDLYGREVGHNRLLHVIGDTPCSTGVASPGDRRDDTGEGDGR